MQEPFVRLLCADVNDMVRVSLSMHRNPLLPRWVSSLGLALASFPFSSLLFLELPALRCVNSTPCYTMSQPPGIALARPSNIPRNTLSKRLKAPQPVQDKTKAVAELLHLQKLVCDKVSLLYFELDVEVFVHFRLPPKLERALESYKGKERVGENIVTPGYEGVEDTALMEDLKEFFKSHRNDRAT